MDERVGYEKRGRVGVITVDNPPVNALSLGVAKAVIEALKRGLADSDVAGFVLTGAGGTFVTGAENHGSGEPRAAMSTLLRELIAAIEESNKPVVAAMEGEVLVGGLEVALGCDWRVGLRGALYGFPEVKDGLIPGAGGTQRAPRLIGAKAALAMIVGGDPVPSERALELGLIDQEIEGGLMQGALAFAERVLSERRPLRRVAGMTVERGALSDDYFDDYRKRIAQKARGQLAPFLDVDCVEAATRLRFAEGMKKERELFECCLESPQHKALTYALLAECEAVMVPGLRQETPRRAVQSAGIVGAGTMGRGIAISFANAGIPVHLVEDSRDALEEGLKAIRGTYVRSVERGRLSAGDVEKRLGYVTGGLSLEHLAEADIVIEAVFEDMDLKRDVFRKLDRACRRDAILATNTSTLDVDEIASATDRPEKVIGTHFFSPAQVMRLIETVRGAKTSLETIATAFDLAERLGKIPVLVGVCDGFVGNRMLYAYLREAGFLLEEGALPWQVDNRIVEFGMPMGPFAMCDLAGLDVGYRVRKRRAMRCTSHFRYSGLADKICEMGRLGQKTGKGWYRYEPGERTPIRDPEIEALIMRESAELGMERREIGEDEIVERCIYALINEGARVLEEGIVPRASDIDVVWINGYGFPRWRGGPMYYADSVGLETIYEVVCRYHRIHGPHWEPAQWLKRFAAGGKKFTDLGRTSPG